MIWENLNFTNIPARRMKLTQGTIKTVFEGRQAVFVTCLLSNVSLLCTVIGNVN